MFIRHRSIFISLIAVAGGLSACAVDHNTLSHSTGSSASAYVDVNRAASFRSPAEIAAIAALHQLGTPYKYGGSSPNGFDCSGLVVFAYQKAGVQLPRTTAGLWKELSQVNKKHLRTGDILFFNIGGKVSHVGMYLGSGRFIHSPQSGQEVSVANLESGFYRQTFVGAARAY